MRTVPMNLLFDDIEVIESVGDPSAVEVGGITHDSRRVVPGDLFCCVPGQVSDGHVHATEAVERGAVGLLCEHFIPELLDRDIVQTRVARGHDAARHGAARRRLLRVPGAGSPDDRRHRHQRQDHRDADPRRSPRCDGAADQRHGNALRCAHDARGHRGPARPRRRARPAEVRRLPSRRRHGGVEPRARPVARRGHPLRRGRLHQPQPRPSRLSRHHGGLLRSEGDALHLEARVARDRARRRRMGPAPLGAIEDPDRGGPPQRCDRRRAAARAHRVHLAGPADHDAADRCDQRRQHPAGGRGGAGPGRAAPRTRGDRRGPEPRRRRPGEAPGDRLAGDGGGRRGRRRDLPSRSSSTTPTPRPGSRWCWARPGPSPPVAAC